MRTLFGCLGLLGLLASVWAQGVTQPFTYQGYLRQGGAPLNNPSQSMQFRIYDALIGGTLLWNSGAFNVNVSNGLFTVQLNPPVSIWTGADRFLEIQVGATTLSPRVRLGSTPYANTSTLLNLFQTGTTNPDRMVITHSPAYIDWGLLYRDTADEFHFVASGNSSLSVRLSDGDLTFYNDSASITFPSADATNAPMIHMFSAGAANANRMVIAHSPAYIDWGLQYRDSNDTFHFLRAGISVLSIGNNVGIGVESPGFRLEVDGRIRLRGEPGDNTAGLWLSTGTNTRAFVGLVNDNAVGLWGNAGAGWQLQMSTVTGNVGIGGAPTGEKLRVYGTARVNVLEIAGADLAEKFPTTETLEPGTVVEIDPEIPGHLRKAQGAYNKRVAGVVAGANGLSKGIILGNLEGSESHTPIAMSGRVWVYADATHEAIEQGDLLTTSDMPGHAMKASDLNRANGALIGKAMTRLEKGKTGMVLVLVNLQ